jgi:aconitate hydratase
VQPSVAGPKRPQDRIELPKLKQRIHHCVFSKPVTENGFGMKAEELSRTCMSRRRRDSSGRRQPGAGVRKRPVQKRTEMANEHPTPDQIHAQAPRLESGNVRNGSVLIAAITSCTNTSQSERDAGRRFAREEGGGTRSHVNSTVKASLAPGSRVVSDYLNKTGLQPYLDKLGFNLVGYGCTTCIGNSGPLHPAIEDAVVKNNLVAASVLSGNRNFEARVHQNIKANFLMSPPLVVAFALAGRVDIDLAHDPLGTGKDGKPVFCATSGRACGSPRPDAGRVAAGSVPQACTRISPRKIRSGTKFRPAPATFTSGTASPLTSRSRRSSRIFDAARQHRPIKGAARWPFLATA